MAACQEIKNENVLTFAASGPIYENVFIPSANFENVYIKENLLPQSQIMKTFSVLAAAKSIYENVFISLLLFLIL